MQKIEVTDLRKITSDGKIKAFADIKIADAVIVKGFTVVQGRSGVFVAMPRKASRDGRWFDILIPVNDEVKREIEDAILEAYDRES